MRRSPWATAFLIVSTVVASLVLDVLPLPLAYAWLRPEWPLLVLMFWSMRYPGDFSVGSGWLLGLAIDGIEGSPLGQHALALSIVSFLIVSLNTRLSLLSSFQQSVVLMVLVGVYQLFSIWVQNVSGIPTGSLMFLWSCLTTAICWPVVQALLGKLAK